MKMKKAFNDLVPPAQQASTPVAGQAQQATTVLEGPPTTASMGARSL